VSFLVEAAIQPYAEVLCTTQPVGRSIRVA
jgi:hypothetical protein